MKLGHPATHHLVDLPVTTSKRCSRKMANLSVVATFHVFSKRRLQILLNLLLTISYHLPLSCQHFNRLNCCQQLFPQLGPLSSLCPKSASAASGASTRQQCLHQPKTPPCWHLMCNMLSFALPYASVSSLKVKRFQKSSTCSIDDINLT